jgi:signal transduction histidine kinase
MALTGWCALSRKRRLVAVVMTVATPLALVWALVMLAGEQADRFLFVPILGAAAVSSLLGARAGIVASALSTASLAWWAFDGGGALSGFEAARFAGSAAVSLLVAWATGSLRSAYRRAAAERAAAIAAADELSRAKAEAEHAVEVRDEVLAVVSHDLKSPLASIGISADLLLRRSDRQAPDLARHARKIQQRVTEMSRLIGDLLDAASLEAGGLAIRPRATRPDAIAHDAIERARPLADAAGIALHLDVDRDLPELVCDPERILQVLANLIGNALKVTPGGGRVGVRVEDSSGEVRFTVSDDGPGIAGEDLPHLFDRFRRGRNASYHGTGLGLAIVRGIVEAHDGRVWAQSFPGQGARFAFVLPRHGAVDAEPDRHPEYTRPASHA